MDGTKELVDAQQVGLALVVVMAVAVIAAIGFGFADRQKPSPTARKGLILALCGVALYPMWLVYNAIEDALGLDSVAGLLTNLVLFLAVGATGGLLARRFWPGEPDLTAKTPRTPREAENAG